MIDVLSTEAMQACDRAAIETLGIPGVVLMENAGLQTVESVLEHFDGRPLSTLVLCGRGNNGGDGMVVARHLYNLGGEVAVVLLGEPDGLSADAAANWRILEAMGVPTRVVADEETWERSGPDPAGFDCVVDAMLGTGIDSAARGVIARAIARVNGCGVPVVAVDLPSGLSADSGRPPGDAIAAELTVTFAAPKCCHVLPPASDLCGDLVVVDISIPDAVLADVEPSLRLLEPHDWRRLLPSRRPASHKGDYGRVLVVGGAPGTAGAAVLAARGALRGGAGLVHVACPDSVYGVVAGQLTEALVHGLPAAPGGALGAAAGAGLRRLADEVDVVALGPGIGTGEQTRELVVELAAELATPTVVDADGLNGLAGGLGRIPVAAGPRVLTPHPGEAGRLLGRSAGEVQEDRPGALADLVEASGATVLLKGHRTLIGAPRRVPVVNPSGNPGLATGGTGDVLTGLVAALIAQGAEPFDAAWGAAWLHGRAGDLAAAAIGETALVAGDLVEFLSRAMGEGDGAERRPRA